MAHYQGNDPTQPHYLPPAEPPHRDPLVLVLAVIALAAAIGAIIIGLLALGQDDGGGDGGPSVVTVGTDDIEDGAVTEPKLADGAGPKRPAPPLSGVPRVRSSSRTKAPVDASSSSAPTFGSLPSQPAIAAQPSVSAESAASAAKGRRERDRAPPSNRGEREPFMGCLRSGGRA